MTPQSGSRESSYQELPERSRRILAGLIQQYIEKGEPVSSLWLAQHGCLGWSSATVRQVMAKLEGLGFVHQPHTSAGRVPTDLGYRAYVDLLLEDRRIDGPMLEIEARLRQAGTVNDILSNVCHELSKASHHMGFALLSPAVGALQHVDFVQLEGSRVLVVLSTDGKETAHKVVDLGERMAASDLDQGANYLNRAFIGQPLWKVRAAVIAQLRQERMLYDQLRSRALMLASSTLEDMVPQNSLFFEGASFLLDEVSDDEERVPRSTLRAMLMLIEQKDQLVRLLNEYIDGPGLTVVIGTEHSSPEMQDFSLVMSTYFDGQRTGSVGVIGPRRMRYSSAIATVDSISRAASRVLVDSVRRIPDHEGKRQTRSA
jgi:heat-inducible transcriptional repressor